MQYFKLVLGKFTKKKKILPLHKYQNEPLSLILHTIKNLTILQRWRIYAVYVCLGVGLSDPLLSRNRFTINVEFW